MIKTNLSARDQIRAKKSPCQNFSLADALKENNTRYELHRMNREMNREFKNIVQAAL